MYESETYIRVKAVKHMRVKDIHVNVKEVSAS